MNLMNFPRCIHIRFSKCRFVNDIQINFINLILSRLNEVQLQLKGVQILKR